MTQKEVSLKGRNLMVAIPAYDGKLAITAAFSLPVLALDSVKYGFEIHLAHISGSSIITRARNILVKQFMESDCTDLLFIDADIHFKAGDVLRILAMSDDKDVVAGAYPRRGGSTAFFTDIDYGPNDEVYMDDGLLRVKRIGTGFMLIRRHVLETLHNKHPEWAYFVDSENCYHYSIFDFKSTKHGYVGEDYLFCDRVREAGFKVHLDPEINLGHYGSTEYTGNFKEQVLDVLAGKR
jgi:hypothetical protein